MFEGLLYETRLKLEGTGGISGRVLGRRCALGLGFGLLPRVTILSVINAVRITG